MRREGWGVHTVSLRKPEVCAVRNRQSPGDDRGLHLCGRGSLEQIELPQGMSKIGECAFPGFRAVKFVLFRKKMGRSLSIEDGPSTISSASADRFLPAG